MAFLFVKLCGDDPKELFQSVEGYPKRRPAIVLLGHEDEIAEAVRQHPGIYMRSTKTQPVA